MIDAPGHADFGFGASGLWVLAGGFVHWMTEEGRSLHDSQVGDQVTKSLPARCSLPSCLLLGRVVELCELYDGQLFCFPLVLGTRPGEHLFPIGPRLLAVSTPETLRITSLERGTIFKHDAPKASPVVSVTPMYGGYAVVIVFGGESPQVWAITASGEFLVKQPIAQPDRIAVAEDRGLLVVATGQKLRAYDLRNSGEPDIAKVPFAFDDFDICARAMDLILAKQVGKQVRSWRVRFSEIFKQG